MPPRDFGEVHGAEDRHPLDQLGLFAVGPRHDHAADARLRRRHDRGKHAGHGAQPPVETEFTQMHRRGEGRGIHRRLCRERGDRDRDVEPGALLGQARRARD